MKLTESQLRNIIREELSRLTEVGIDRGFLNGFAESLEDLTGQKAYVKDNTAGNEDVVYFDGKNNGVDLYFRSGGARGGRTEEPSIQIYNSGRGSSSVRSGFTAPNNPQDAAKRAHKELKKLNEA